MDSIAARETGLDVNGAVVVRVVLVFLTVRMRMGRIVTLGVTMGVRVAVVMAVVLM